MKINLDKLKKANQKSFQGIWKMLPIIFSILLLVSIINVLIPAKFYAKLFQGNLLTNLFTGTILGSVLTGNPVTGYILGKGFLDKGVDLIVVTAFLSAWVTVGLVQLPAESLVLGKKFAIFRNVSAFFMAMIVALVTIGIINLF